MDAAGEGEVLDRGLPGDVEAVGFWVDVGSRLAAASSVITHWFFTTNTSPTSVG